MKRRALLLAAAPLLLLSVPACRAHAEGTKDEGFRLIGADELATKLKDADHPVHVYDANEPAFRKKNGVIPEATLLSSFNKYDVAKELPADKAAALVFYCANQH